MVFQKLWRCQDSIQQKLNKKCHNYLRIICASKLTNQTKLMLLSLKLNSPFCESGSLEKVQKETVFNLYIMLSIIL